MGCISAKNRCSVCHDRLMNLDNIIHSYQSMYDYIQRLRQDVFDSLLKDASEEQLQNLGLQETDVITLDSMSHDLSLFRKMKHLNKYKYEVVVSKFKKNMQDCVYKIENIEDINFKILDEFNSLGKNNKNIHQNNHHHHLCASSSGTHQKSSLLSMEFQDKLNHLDHLISQLNVYLEEEREEPINDQITCTQNTMELLQQSHAKKRSSVCKRLSSIQINHLYNHEEEELSPTNI